MIIRRRGKLVAPFFHLFPKHILTPSSSYKPDLFPKHILTPSSSYKPEAARCFHRLAGFSCKRLIFSKKNTKNMLTPKFIL